MTILFYSLRWTAPEGMYLCAVPKLKAVFYINWDGSSRKPSSLQVIKSFRAFDEVLMNEPPPEKVLEGVAADDVFKSIAMAML